MCQLSCDMATATTASAGTRSSGSFGSSARAHAAARHAATVIAAGQPPATAGTIDTSSRSPTGVSSPWLKRMSESLT